MNWHSSAPSTPDVVSANAEVRAAVAALILLAAVFGAAFALRPGPPPSDPAKVMAAARRAGLACDRVTGPIPRVVACWIDRRMVAATLAHDERDLPLAARCTGRGVVILGARVTALLDGRGRESRRKRAHDARIFERLLNANREPAGCHGFGPDFPG